MKIEVNFEKRYMVLGLAVLLVLVGAIFVVAQQFSGVSNPGHAIECVTVKKAAPPSSNGVRATCPSGYIVFGCAGGCRGSTSDYDLYFFGDGTGCGLGDNSCSGSDPEINVQARCCKIP